MRSGTPGFIGDRLREAREARGITAAALADVLGISKQSISLYEQNGATPSPEHASLIVERLNLPLRFFLDPEPSEDAAPIFWRSMAAATRTARMSARRRFDWLRKVARYLEKYVAFPDLSLPPPLSISDPSAITDAMVEQAAADARHFFGLGTGAIANVCWLMENRGIIVGFSELGAATLDAFSQAPSDGHAYALVNSDHGTAVRYRFDLAHELGHLILHRMLDSRFLLDSTRNKLMEDQAHAFARFFLMPPEVFAKHFHALTVDGLRIVKRTWKVSMQSALVHASRLDLLTEKQSQRMWRGLSARGWRRAEPLDDLWGAERPELLRSAFTSILQGGVARPDDVLAALPYTGREIETLCGLDPGTLVGEEHLGTSLFDFGSITRQRPPSAPRRDKPMGDVVAFPGTRRDK
ncbi:MAG: helix-turn-helix domain-containing protein [Vulcanimicrobiaceae bacterium]